MHYTCLSIQLLCVCPVGVLRHLLHQLCFLAGADITEVFTREGDNAILPCALDSPVDLTDEAFDWKKEPQEVFFYIQGKDYNNGREGQDPQFVGRVGLTQGGLQAGNASVVLSSVTQADSGVYKCVILTRRTNRWIRLTVASAQQASPSSGSVRLSCVSRGGQPQPSGLEWQTPNGTVIPAEEAPPAASSDSDGRYSISQTVKVTEPGSYTCLARQQGLKMRTRIPSHRCPPLLLCGFCPCVGCVGVVCVAYKNTSRPFRAADPAHVQEVLFAVENDPCCYRVESCRVVSSRATCAVEKRH
uniref:Ig-like domain-containing protein n=1 Tax=Gadus morhua TaxID=8049 RepID=A0A8C5ATL2_GADMO